jgi:hypothetical protein
VRTVEFRRLLDDKNALRVRFELEKSQVLNFMIQLECRFTDEWQPIVRYDTAHNFAHRDLLHPSGETEKTKLTVRNYNEALNFALMDLTENWQKYGRRYEQWLKQK